MNSNCLNKKLPPEVSPWKKDFPLLEREVYGRPLVYLDNAATTQMPECSVNRICEYYRSSHSNVHRGAHYLGDKATSLVEETRRQVQQFLHAASPEEIIFTSGTTDSISLAANGIRHRLKKGTAVLVTELEHHSNYLPWQNICTQTGADFLIVPIDEAGNPDMAAMEELLKNNHVFLVAAAHVSNSVGTETDIESIARLAHYYGAQVLVDGAQKVRHGKTDVTALDCEYYCFSAHKMMGPTGLGVLYGKKEYLEDLIPLRLGGGMAREVGPERSVYEPLPHRLEAGTPPIAEIAAFSSTLDYLDSLGCSVIGEYEDNLLNYLEELLKQREDIMIMGAPDKRAGVISFHCPAVHSFDIASMLDKQGIAVRSGKLCARPALAAFDLDSVVRVSPAFYNGKKDLDIFYEALIKTLNLLES